MTCQDLKEEEEAASLDLSIFARNGMNNNNMKNCEKELNGYVTFLLKNIYYGQLSFVTFKYGTYCTSNEQKKNQVGNIFKVYPLLHILGAFADLAQFCLTMAQLVSVKMSAWQNQRRPRRLRPWSAVAAKWMAAAANAK